jgi:Tfp pilus assembly protein PilF
MIRRLRGPGLIVLLLWIGGCATAPVPSSPTADPDAVSEQRGRPATGSSEQSPSSADAATLALLEQSERAVQNGSLTQALTYTERAVRIDPRNPALWTRLATLELANGKPQAALQYADKALSLSADRPPAAVERNTTTGSTISFRSRLPL